MFIYGNSRHENQLVCILTTLVNTQPNNQPGWWFKGLTATDLESASHRCSHVRKAGLALTIWSPKASPGPAVLVGASARNFRRSFAFPPAHVISSTLSDTAQGQSALWGWDAVTKPQLGWTEAPTAGVSCVLGTLPNPVLSLADGAAGSLRRPLQPDLALGADGFLQHGPEAALPLHLPLLPAPDLQAEGHEAALLGGHAAHGHLPLHPLLPLRGVQLLGTRGHGRQGQGGAAVGEEPQETIQGQAGAPSTGLQRGQD